MDLSNIKIIFIDIDGTLVNSKKEITKKTKDSIKRVVEKGIKVVLISGRDIIHTIEKSKEANASSVVISTNGAKIYDYENKKVIFEDIFPKQKIVDVWNYCMFHKIGLILKSNEFVYYNKYSLVKKGTKYKLLNDISECEDFNVSQILIMSNECEEIENMHKYALNKEMFVTSFSSSYFENTISNYYSIDVNNSNVSKGTAISYLLNYLNIKKEESLCFGDYYNDLDMFEASGIKVAMRNAADTLKEKSDFITKSNDENGIAYFLNKYL